MEGRADALKGPVQSNQIVFEYKENDYFGELALLGDKKRQATIRAKTDMVVASLDTDAFKRLLGPIEPLLKRNREKYEKFQFKLTK
jgi:cAMP-dependent protein kinase regulator